MIRPFATFERGVLLAAALCFSLHAGAQAPALTRDQKAAAAAVEAPRPYTPPPLPGQLMGQPAPAPVAPAPAMVAPPPAAVPAAAPQPAPSGKTLSKTEALEAMTQQPMVKEAPRVVAPSDKVPVTSSTSTTGQFIVHGKVFETRSAMSSRCEQISEELRKALNDREPWVLPVVVLLNTGAEAVKSPGPTVGATITEITHGGFHLQVTVNDRPDLKMEDLRKEVVRALLAERILRNHEKITVPEGRMLLPDWVMTGVLQAMTYKASARPSVIFSTIFRSGKIYGIEEIIAASPVEMDSLSRAIYETSCCALVLALADQPEGGRQFNKFLNALASDPRTERQLLDAAFPKFAASASSLNKWWSLQMAALSKPGLAEQMTALDSLRAIEQAIQIRYGALPAEVPQGIKPRPFVLPTPLAVAPPPKPKPTLSMPEVANEARARSQERAVAAGNSAAAESTPEAASSGEAAATGEEASPRRALWRRMLFLGAPKPEEKTPEAEEEKSGPGFFSRLNPFGGDEKEEKKMTEEPVEEEKSGPGFFGRLNPFGGGSTKEEKKAESKAVDVKKAEDAKPEEEHKPSALNPMNWFRSGKKPAEGKKEESEKPSKEEKPKGKDGQAAVLPLEWPQVDPVRLLSPALADAWKALAPAAPRPTVDMLKFFRGKNKDEGEEPEPEKVEAPKSAEPTQPKREEKPQAKSDAPTKPRTTNPNAKPASRPKAEGQQATTNPKAKPVPATPKAAAQPGGEKITLPGLEPGQVVVVLPLEEYERVMKRPDRKEIFDRCIVDLRALEMRVNTLLRPVVSAYMAVMVDLKDGKTKDMEKRLETLHQFALVAYQKSIAVRDYMDWFEANENGALSGKFDDYLNLPSLIQKELPAREDPISKYLDAIDKEFSE